MLRVLACLAAPFSTCLAQSGFPGAKKDLVLPASGGGSVGPAQLLQMLVAVVAVVIILKWLVPKTITKLQPKKSSSLGSTIEVQETTTMGTATLAVIKVRGKTLLIGTGPSGTQLLADLTKPEPPAFFEMLDKASQVPTHAVIESPDTKAIEALERLQRITG